MTGTLTVDVHEVWVDVTLVSMGIGRPLVALGSILGVVGACLYNVKT